MLTRLPGATTEHSIKAETYHRGMRHWLPVPGADFVAARGWEAREVCAATDRESAPPSFGDVAYGFRMER